MTERLYRLYNVTCVFTLSRDVAAHMMKKELVHGRRGTIIDVGLIMSFKKGYIVSACAAAKGKIAQLTRSFSTSWQVMVSL